MPLDAALLELKDRLKRLAAAVVVLKKRLADGCPDESHYLVGRMHDAVTAAAGWLRKARRAVRRAADDPAAARKPLVKFDHVFAKLRQELRRDLTSPQPLADLADLGRRKKEWADWVGDVRSAATDLRRATTATSRTRHTCWRELASQPTTGGVSISNTLIAGPSRSRRQTHREG